MLEDVLYWRFKDDVYSCNASYDVIFCFLYTPHLHFLDPKGGRFPLMPLSSENFTRRGILSFLWFLQSCRSSYLFFQTEKDHFQFTVNVKPNFWLHIHIEFSLSFGLAHKKKCTRPVDTCWLEMSKNYFLIFCFFLCHAVSPAAFLLSHFEAKSTRLYRRATKVQLCFQTAVLLLCPE